jgi:molybdopterin-guanine dinucleotide biosynthesis protein A
MGGAKAGALLAGRPLVSYPAEALGEVCARVAVVCKPDTPLPDLPAGVERWDEPAEPRHPVAGIGFALERVAEPVLVCAADMPFVTAAECGALTAAMKRGASAVVAVARGRLQPVFGVYLPAALPLLTSAEPDEPLTRIVERLEPVLVELPEAAVRSVNTPQQLAEAESSLRRLKD